MDCEPKSEAVKSNSLGDQQEAGDKSQEDDLGRACAGLGLIFSGHGGGGGGELRPHAGSRVSQPQLLMVSGTPLLGPAKKGPRSVINQPF